MRPTWARLLGLVLRLAVVTLLLLGPAAADAAPKVLAQRSHWDPARRFIWSDVDVQHDDGRLQVYRVPGGSVDGIAMKQVMQLRPATKLPYVPQVTTMSKKRMRWRSGCVYITPDSRGSSDIPGDEEFRVIKKVLDNWDASTAGCGYLRFRRNATYVGELGYDGVNRVIFREDSWCPPGVEPGDRNCYPPEATAITTIFHVDNPSRSDDGQIIDADIELNSIHYAMAVGCEGTCQSEGTGDLEDLENTLTHEVGHVIGLDHPCYTPRFDDNGNVIGDPPIDGDGNEVPPCDPEGALSDEIREATMFASQSAGEIKKRSLEADDIAGFCDLYPLGDDPDRCDPVYVDEGGCEIVSVDESSPWGLVLLFGAIGLVTARACSRNRRR
jgi:hypothetical protein